MNILLYAYVNSAFGPELYEEYKSKGFPGIAWDTEIILVFSSSLIDYQDLTRSDQVLIAMRHNSGKVMDNIFKFKHVYAYQEFKHYDSAMKIFNHKSVIPHLNVPSDLN